MTFKSPLLRDMEGFCENPYPDPTPPPPSEKTNSLQKKAIKENS